MSKLKIVKGEYYEPDEKLRQWLEKYIEDHPHLPTSELERDDHVGYSRTALDAYLKGTYFLPKSSGGVFNIPPKKSRIEDKIRDYRDRMEGVIRHGVRDSFIPTRLWQQFQFLCKTAIEEKAIVIGYGKPGAGKSRALLQYKTEKMQTNPVEIFCSANITTRYFIQKIAKEIGVDTRPPTAQLEDMVAEKLRKGPTRLLFVDQANYLNEKSLGTICYLWEKANRNPIVLIGTKDLFDLFMSSRMTQDVRAQLTSRVAWHCPFVELDISEVKSIVTAMLGKRANTAVIEQIHNITGGNHRHLNMMMPRLTGIVRKNEQKIDDGSYLLEEIVAEAGMKLLVA